jgi:hypothetical protein
MKRIVFFWIAMIGFGLTLYASPEAVTDSIENQSDWLCYWPHNLRGETTEEGALIEWSYTNYPGDLPVKHFNVYRSTIAPNYDFELIARVPAEEGVSEYHYLDPIHEGMAYYYVKAYHEEGELSCESIPSPTSEGHYYVPLDMDFEKGNWQFYDFWDYYGSLGLNGNHYFYWAVRFTGLRMQQFVGQYVTRFALYDPEIGQGNYTLKLYSGGENAPGQCLTTEHFPLQGTNDWHYDDFSDPVQVTADHLWVVVTSHGLERPAAAVYGMGPLAGMEEGNWISPDGQEWYHLDDYLGSEYQDIIFMVRIMLSSLDGAEEEIVFNDAQVYPNPTTGILHVEADDLKGAEVYDMMGHLVVSQISIQSDTVDIDLSFCLSGIYLVKLITSDGVVTRRISVCE